MAVTKLSGFDGNVYFAASAALATVANAVASIDSWTYTANQEVFDTTSFADTVRRVTPGFITATGTISGTFSSGDTNGQKMMIDLLSSGGTMVTKYLRLVGDRGTGGTALTSIGGMAWLTSINIGSSVGGKATFSANFQFDEIPNYTDA